MQEIDINTVVEILSNIGNYPFVIAMLLFYRTIMKVFKALNKDKEEVIPVVDAILNIFIKVQDTRIKINGNNQALYKAKIASKEAKDSHKEYLRKRRNKKLKASKKKLEAFMKKFIKK